MISENRPRLRFRSSSIANCPRAVRAPTMARIGDRSSLEKPRNVSLFSADWEPFRSGALSGSAAIVGTCSTSE